MKKITCVIVTFNRLETLKLTIDAIQKQTRAPDACIIVNNASTDGTKEFLDSISSSGAPIKAIHLEKNTGGAGGFKRGIKEAIKDECDWVWIMDDDCICTETCLEKLLDAEKELQAEGSREIGFLCSQVLWKNNDTCLMNIPVAAWNWNQLSHINVRFTKVYSASFVSCLINARAIKKLGLPVEEFFIWYDDVEYTSRISTVFDSYHIADSLTHHYMEANIGYDPSTINQKNIWKFKYGFRNHISVIAHRHGFKLIPAMRQIINEYITLKRHRIPLTLRLEMLNAGLRGLTFDYRKYIEHTTQ